MADQRGSSRWLSVLAAVALPLGAMAQEIRLGSEFQVNTYTTSDQSVPVGGGRRRRRLRRRLAELRPGRLELRRLRPPLLDRGRSPGRRVPGQHLHHERPAPPVGGDGRRRRLRRRLAELRPGRLGYGVFARRFSSAGAPLAGEFQVNTYTTELPALPVGGGGRRRRLRRRLAEQRPGRLGLRRLRPPLLERGRSPRPASSRSTPTPRATSAAPSVALDADGDFVVAWQSYGQDGSDYGVFARRFSSAGARPGRRVPGQHLHHEPPAHPVGGAGRRRRLRRRLARATARTARATASSPAASRARALALAGEFQVNTYTTSTQRYPSVAADADGDFVVAWESNGQDGSSDGVFAQRFAALAALDIDGNGTLDPLTDGLLVLRFLFGFTGATLTTGAVGAGCTRCDAAAIEPYLDERRPRLLDIDGDGRPSLRSPTACSSCASCSASPARRSPAAPSAATARAATRPRSSPTCRR